MIEKFKDAYSKLQCLKPRIRPDARKHVVREGSSPTIGPVVRAPQDKEESTTEDAATLFERLHDIHHFDH